MFQCILLYLRVVFFQSLNFAIVVQFSSGCLTRIIPITNYNKKDWLHIILENMFALNLTYSIFPVIHTGCSCNFCQPYTPFEHENFWLTSPSLTSKLRKLFPTKVTSSSRVFTCLLIHNENKNLKLCVEHKQKLIHYSLFQTHYKSCK